MDSSSFEENLLKSLKPIPKFGYSPGFLNVSVNNLRPRKLFFGLQNVAILQHFGRPGPRVLLEMRIETFDEWCEESDGGRLASTGWKIESDLLQFVSKCSSTVLGLGTAVWHICTHIISHVKPNDTAANIGFAWTDKYVNPLYCGAEIYAGCIACCPLVSHDNYAPRDLLYLG